MSPGDVADEVIETFRHRCRTIAGVDMSNHRAARVIGETMDLLQANLEEAVKAKLQPVVDAGNAHWKAQAERERVRSNHAFAVLQRLVELKDGPRDDTYRALKDIAWENARRILRGQPLRKE